MMLHITYHLHLFAILSPQHFTNSNISTLPMLPVISSPTTLKCCYPETLHSKKHTNTHTITITQGIVNTWYIRYIYTYTYIHLQKNHLTIGKPTILVIHNFHQQQNRASSMAANSFAGCTLSALSSNSSGLKPSTTKLASVTCRGPRPLNWRPSPVGVGAGLHSPDGSSASFFSEGNWITSWWFQPNPFEKICSSNWVIYPSRDERKKYLSCHHLDYCF